MTDEPQPTETRPVDDPVRQLTGAAWYDANTMRALLTAGVGLIGVLLSLFGVDDALFSANAAKAVDALSTFITLVGVVWAGYARTRQPTPPLYLSRARANAANAASSTLPVLEISNATQTTVAPSAPADPAGAGELRAQPGQDR